MRVACTLFAVIRLASGAIVANSRLEQCFNDGEAPIDCNRRLVIALAIASGQRGTEEIHTVVDRSESMPGGGTNAEEEERELEAPIRISLSKTEAIVRYPVTVEHGRARGSTEQAIIFDASGPESLCYYVYRL